MTDPLKHYLEEERPALLDELADYKNAHAIGKEALVSFGDAIETLKKQVAALERDKARVQAALDDVVLLFPEATRPMVTFDFEEDYHVISQPD